MQKIPTLFKRDPVTHLVIDDCSFPDVLTDRRYTPTVKMDGTSCYIQDGNLYKRFTLKKGEYPPITFIPAQYASDPITGELPGWTPVDDGPGDKWYREAWAKIEHDTIPWTYELIGPKVQGNPYGLTEHMLVRHGATLTGLLTDIHVYPSTFDACRDYLSVAEIEGIVWWYAGRPVAKLKRRDFGFEWPIKVIKE